MQEPSLHTPAEQTENVVHQTHAEHGREFALLQFDPGVGIWAVLTFTLLLILLKKLAWKPILDSIEQRDQKLKESIDSAAKLKEANDHQIEEQKKILTQTREEAAVILAEARKSAEQLRQQILDAAQVEKESALNLANQEIDQMKHKAKEELKAFSADLAIGAAEKILREKIDDTTGKKLANEYIQEIEI